MSSRDALVSNAKDTGRTKNVRRTSVTHPASMRTPPKYGIGFVDRDFTGVLQPPGMDLTARARAGTGQSLPGSVRGKMESALGMDFSLVRIHEGSKAASVHARACTQGMDIHFAAGQYQPHSQRGQALLGHELAHVVQQAQGRVPVTGQVRGVAVNTDPRLEAEADRWGAMAARGMQPAQISPAGRRGPPARTATLQRKPEAEVEVDMAGKRQEILDASDQGVGSVFRKDDEVQTELRAGYGQNAKQRLTPHFTSVGFEIEFAQRPLDKRSGNTGLGQAHTEVAAGRAAPLYPNIPCKLETDADYALEFVTAPMLAPLENVAGGGQPVGRIESGWQKSVALRLEAYLRGIVDRPKVRRRWNLMTIRNIINRINRDLGVGLRRTGVDWTTAQFKSYGAIVKGQLYWDSKDLTYRPLARPVKTLGQLNFMTTLQGYVGINGADLRQGKAGRIADILKRQGALQNVGPDAEPYILVLSQKIREIPNMLVDETLARVVNGEAINGVVYEKGDDARTNLGRASSKVKDEGILWLKASLAQLLTAFPRALVPQLAEAVTNAVSDIIDELMNGTHYKRDPVAAVVRVLVGNDQRSWQAQKTAVAQYIEARLGRVISLLDVDQANIEEIAGADVQNRPREQNLVRADESHQAVIGARRDTYVPSSYQTEVDMRMFLVETRPTADAYFEARGTAVMDDEQYVATNLV